MPVEKDISRVGTDGPMYALAVSGTGRPSTFTQRSVRIVLRHAAPRSRRAETPPDGAARVR